MSFCTLSEVWGNNFIDNQSSEEFTSETETSVQNLSDEKKNIKSSEKIFKKNTEIIQNKNKQNVIKPKKIIKVKRKKNKKCSDCDSNIQKVLNCESCVRKMKKKLKMKNNIVDNVVEENRDLIVSILLCICIILFFDTLKNDKRNLRMKYYNTGF